MAQNDDWIEVPIEKSEAKPVDDWHEVPLEPSLGEKALNAVGMAGKAVDAYGGDASTRAAIYAAQKGKPVVQAFTDQYGKSEGAPTGKDISMEAGVEDKPFSEGVQFLGRGLRDDTRAGRFYKSVVPQTIRDRIENSTKADVAGVGVEMAASPLNLMPAGKPITKGLSEVGQFIKNSLKTGAETVGLDKAANAVGRGAASVAEAISGAPKRDYITYATKTPEVKDLIKSSGGSSANIADTIREGYQGALTGKRKELNSAISAAEEGASSKKTVSIEPVISSLEKQRSQLHKELDATEISQIDELIQKLENSSNSRGKIAPDDLVKVTKSLQNKAEGAYAISPSGAQLGKQVQRAAKGGAAEARTLRNAALPDVVEPFQKLERINEVADVANPNLFVPGKPDPSLFAAASGRNDRGLKALQEMGDAVGQDFVGPAEIGSAARTFSNPPLTPSDTTGKSLHRALLSAGIFGHGLGILGAPVEAAAKLGAAAASPAALKAGIDTAKFAGGLPGKAMEGLQKVPTREWVRAYIASRAARAAEMERRKKRKEP